MSTNKTKNYGLHSWEPKDDFHLSEINENFTTLDGKLHEEVGVLDGLLKAETQARTQGLAAKADATLLAAKADSATVTALDQALKDLDGRKIQIITGSYNTGSRVELGVKPLAVISMIARGNMSSTTTWSGIASQDVPLGTALVLDESGFTPGDDTGSYLSLFFPPRPWHYIVFY